MNGWLGRSLCSAAAASLVAACSTGNGAGPRRVVAASPPKDDGKPAQGGAGGLGHAAALEQLKTAPIVARSDKQNAVRVPLPDAEHWTRVRFLTVKSLVGFRYGKDHHAIFGGFVTHVEDNTVQGACNKSFEQWAAPWVEAFEVEIEHEPPVAFTWSAPTRLRSGSDHAGKRLAIVDVDPVIAKTATIFARDSYAAAWAAYPVWGDKACLILGVAIPERGEPDRAAEVRDRFVREVFPDIIVTGTEEPQERY